MRKIKKDTHVISRRSVLSTLGATAAAFAAGGVMRLPLLAQSRTEIQKGEQNHSASNPGPINKALASENPGSDLPPVTDRGVIQPIWYSFDLTHRRIQDGGWTRQVTETELRSSTDVAGVTMRRWKLSRIALAHGQ